MLELFPAGTLDHTLHTSVLVGLLWVWVLQETLGWGSSGLVVPGYLAAVLAIEPRIGGVMCAEAVVTWMVYSTLSESGIARRLWTPLFGRDRFFGFLVVSVGVRLASEGWAFPLIERAFGEAAGGGLYSMGLVVVPLAANALWRSGLAVGLPRVGLPVVLTWAVLEWVLMRHTNLSLADFELSFEDMALHFNDSPRAYMLLLVGAWMGSQANLRWGWDFGGILVPGLLALCWLYPTRLIATLAEAMVVAGLLHLLLRHPLLRGANLTGQRPLVLGFVLAWSLKFLLGHLLGSRWFGLAAHDLFGFGYLLPTLMALRMVKHGNPLQSVVPALLTSLGGFLTATALGWGLLAALPVHVEPQAAPAPAPTDARRALLLAASTNTGSVPTRPETLLVDGQSGILIGGEGFGGLWVRSHGAPVVLVARAGAPALGVATLSLADALDARGVMLCAAEGEACEAAMEALEVRATVLEVQADGRTSLSARGTLPDALDLQVLGRTLGELTLSSGAARPTLRLSPRDRLALASAAFGTEPAPLDAPSRATLGGALDVATLATLRNEVLEPWLIWARAEDGSREALALAAGMAQLLGLEMAADEAMTELRGADFTARLRRGVAGPAMLAPRAWDEIGTGEMAAALGEALRAPLIVVDRPDGTPEGDAALRRPAWVSLLAALEGLPEISSLVKVRAARDMLTAGADLVLSVGRPLAPDSPRPEIARRLADLGPTLDLDVAWYDGALTRVSFADPDDGSRELARSARGEESAVTVYVGAEARERASARLGGGEPEVAP